MSLSRPRRTIRGNIVLSLAVLLAFLCASCGTDKLLVVKDALDKKPAISVQFQGATAGVWGNISMPSAQAGAPGASIPVPTEFGAVADAVAEGFKEGWGLSDVKVIAAGTQATTPLCVQVNVQGAYRYGDGKWTLQMNTIIVIRDMAEGKNLNGFGGDTVAKVDSAPTEVAGVTPSKNPSEVHRKAMIPHEVILDSLKEATRKGVVDYLQTVKAAKAEGATEEPKAEGAAAEPKTEGK